MLLYFGCEDTASWAVEQVLCASLEVKVCGGLFVGRMPVLLRLCGGAFNL